MKTLKRIVFLIPWILVSISVAGGYKDQTTEKHKSMVQWSSWLGPQKLLEDIMPRFNMENYDISIKVVLGRNIKVNQNFLLLICKNGKLMYLDLKQVKGLKLSPAKKYIYCTVKQKRNIPPGIGILKFKITSGPLENAIISVLYHKLPKSFNQALFAIPDNINVKLGKLSFCLFNAIGHKIAGAPSKPAKPRKKFILPTLQNSSDL